MDDGNLVGVFSYDIDHPCEQNLLARLMSPDGHVVGVMNRGNETCTGVPVMFLSTNAALGAPEFFGGREASGTWTLTMEDDIPGFSGTLDS